MHMSLKIIKNCGALSYIQICVYIKYIFSFVYILQVGGSIFYLLLLFYLIGVISDLIHSILIIKGM